MRKGIIQELAGIRRELRRIGDALESLNQPVWKGMDMYGSGKTDRTQVIYMIPVDAIAEAVRSLKEGKNGTGND